MKLAIVAVVLSACTSLGPMPATTGMSAVLLVTAWLVFHRAEFAFAENV